MREQGDARTGVPVIPLRVTSTSSESLRFPEETRVACDVAELGDAARSLLRDAEIGALTIEVEDPGATLDARMEEAYTLSGGDRGILLRSQTRWGALRGLATLYQLAAQRALPEAFDIQDEPRFPWRGLLLDPARHFLSKAALLRVLDGMALLKLNVLHLHLSDDQGFRLPSRRFPKLRSSEHYSADDLHELVRHARGLGIRIVPELDMPGHVTSWLTAYPEWAPQSFRDDVKVTDRFGVHAACLDPSNPAVYEAIDALIGELGEWFPDEWVHIGGDEVHPTWWQEDAGVQAFAERHGYADNTAIQNAFVSRVVALLRARGKKAVAWDEVLHQDMPELLVQNWRGVTTRDLALGAGRDCLVSAPFYLDLHYPADMHYGFDIGGEAQALIELEDRQRDDPRLEHVAGGIDWTRQWRQIELPSSGQTGALVGGEACLWSELVDEGVLETRLWSRLPAVAERLWSATADASASFYTRLEAVLALPGFDHHDRQRRALRQLGLDHDQVETALLLEPIKWYGRLLGQTALQARLNGQEMPKARPYRLDSVFDRAVDHLSPESLSARAFHDYAWADWLAAAERWSKIETAAWPTDLQGAVAALRTLGGVIVEQGRQLSPGDVWALYGPHGEPAEYLLAVVPPLVAALER